jgi:undecaprenyl diphosphate synthase
MDTPRHIAVVPDGNRRYARKLGKSEHEGHRAGSEVFRQLLDWCKEEKIKELSFWAMSTENLKRSALEVSFLYSLFQEMCDEIIKKHDEKTLENVKIRFCGALNLLPKSLSDKMRKIESLTSGNTEFILNLLVAYGGREELTHAVKSIASEKPSDITEDLVKSRLYVQDDVDLVIRTGHACLSGLLPWQISYAEIIFLDKLWPEFTKQDFKACLAEFSRRKRSFGK